MLRRAGRGRRVHAHALTARDDSRLRPDDRRQPAPERRVVSTRLAAWSITTFLCVLFFAFALTQRESPPRPAPLPTVLYGDALPVSSAFGPDAVCTEYERDSGGGWRCDTALVNSAKLPVHAPARYAGPCAHLKVVDERWICLGNVPGPMRAPEAPSVNS